MVGLFCWNEGGGGVVFSEGVAGEFVTGGGVVRIMESYGRDSEVIDRSPIISEVVQGGQIKRDAKENTFDWFQYPVINGGKRE